MCKLHARPEHFAGPLPGVPLFPGERIERRFARGDDSPHCFRVSGGPEGSHVELSYFVGVDWIRRGEHALYVEPKLDQEEGPRTDYLAMLLAVLRHPDLLGHTRDLFAIDFDAPTIAITQQQDLLTPLLVVQFLEVVRRIVRKGLKKSYYRVKRNYTAAVKGKILVADTLKRSLGRHRQIDIICSHEEFGVNSLENRLLKRALRFVQRYLPAAAALPATSWMAGIFNEVLPVFDQISEEVAEHEIKRTPASVFYREYDEGIHLALLILRRFGYNLNRAPSELRVQTPPFWIDMSKLFELHVLGLLKDAYRGAVLFQEQGHYGRPDFLLCTDRMRMIIDAKYKRSYEHGYAIEDIRQLSGYGRDRKVLARIGCPATDWPQTMVKCLIIYPTRHAVTGSQTMAIDLAQKTAIKEFEQFFKLPITLPTIR